MFNNPLKYTDPSGYSAWTKFRDKVLKPVAAIVISVYLPGSTAIWGAAAGGFGATVATGALAGYVATGSLKGALTGAFTAGAFYGVGSAFGNAEVAFGNGAMTGTFSRAFNDELHFNGEKLKWVDDDGKTVEEWDAVSGREGSTVDDQNVEDVGPIPEGEYYIEQNGLQKYDDFQIQDKALGIVEGALAWWKNCLGHSKGLGNTRTLNSNFW